MTLWRTSRLSRAIAALVAAWLLCPVQPAFAGSIVGWGSMVFDSSELAANDFVAIAAGGDASFALRSDGSIVGWGYNGYGQATPPDGNDFVAISAGPNYMGGQGLALKSDGSIVQWGFDADGHVTPPGGNDFVAIAAGAGTV